MTTPTPKSPSRSMKLWIEKHPAATAALGALLAGVRRSAARAGAVYTGVMTKGVPGPSHIG